MKRKECLLAVLMFLLVSACICGATEPPKGMGAIEGQIEKRKVAHWPEVPEQLQQVARSVTVKFWVKQDGSVSDTFIIQKTSGNSELDGMAVEYVRGMLFEPSLLMGPRWGRITIPGKMPREPVRPSAKSAEQQLKETLGELKGLKLKIKDLEALVVTVMRENTNLKAQNKAWFPPNAILVAKNKKIKAEVAEIKADNMRLKLQGAKSRKVDSLVIASWKGSEILQKTSPFRVNKVPWTIVWSSFPNTDTSKRTCLLNVSIHKENGDLVDIAVDNLNYGGGIFLVNKTGTFYLNINSLFTDWRVRVLEDK